MPRYYGIYLDVQDRLGMVFGGDAHEGERKVNYLLECGAKVKLYSPDDEISDDLRTKADSGEIEWVNRWRPRRRIDRNRCRHIIDGN